VEVHFSIFLILFLWFFFVAHVYHSRQNSMLRFNWFAQRSGIGLSVRVFWHSCYTFLTLLLHCRYTFVTLLLHSCYTAVKLLLHFCYTALGADSGEERTHATGAHQP
jgi:hypothetical protein